MSRVARSGRARVMHLLPDLVRGGGQVVVAELLAHMDRDRFEAHVVALDGPRDMAGDFAALGCPPVVLDGSGPRLLAAVVGAVRSIEPDLIHVHSGRDRKLGQLAALLTRTPVVGHLHSPWAHLEAMHRPDAGATTRAFSRSKAWLRRKVEEHTVVAYVAVGTAVADFHEPQMAAPVHIVHNGIDTHRFAPATRESRDRARDLLGVPRDAPVVTFVGRLAEGKGQDTLISVVAELPGVQLVLLGSGDRHAELVALARRSGVEDRVVFAGDRDDVADLLVSADLFAMASVSEGLPLSVLEALACGVPVVSYDLPGLRDVLGDGQAGTLVDHGDEAALGATLASLLGDPGTLRRMAVAARRTAESRFDSRVMATEVEAVYDSVLEPPDRAGSGSAGVARA